MHDFKAAQTRVRPSGMREVALELPKVTWADVGGHAAIKQRLQEAIEWPQKHPEMLARIGAKVSLGFLLLTSRLLLLHVLNRLAYGLPMEC